MLGGEQSGHIEAIGFEMYTSMLEEAVRKMKGEGGADHETTVVNLGISIRIDDSYIPEENQRLRMYKRVAAAQAQADLAEIRDELQDRYGAIPETVTNLLAAGEIRLLCEQLGIATLERKRTAIEDQPAPAKSAASPNRVPQVSPLRPGSPPALNGLQPLRPGQIARPAAPTRPLQYGTRTVAAREVTNATLAARASIGPRPATAPMRAQAGQIKTMRDMLHIKFNDAVHSDTFANTGRAHAALGPDPAALMKLVSRNAKDGAAFAPNGTLRWPLTSAKAEDVLRETRDLLEALDVTRSVPA